MRRDLAAVRHAALRHGEVGQQPLACTWGEKENRFPLRGIIPFINHTTAVARCLFLCLVFCCFFSVTIVAQLWLWLCVDVHCPWGGLILPRFVIANRSACLLCCCPEYRFLCVWGGVLMLSLIHI